MSQFIDSYSSDEIAETTVRVGLVSILVTGMIYCIALLA